MDKYKIELCKRKDGGVNLKRSYLILYSVHCDSIITRSMGKKRGIYTRPWFKNFNVTSFTYVNKCPTHHRLVCDISQCI